MSDPHWLPVYVLGIIAVLYLIFDWYTRTGTKSHK